MASNKMIGLEEVKCGDDLYVFKADFSFLAALQSKVGNLLECYERVCGGDFVLDDITAIMECSLKSKNGEDIKDKEAEAKDLVTRNGLQECHILCQHLLVYAMVGDEKKQRLRKLEPSRIAKMITEPFLLESSRNRRLLWAYHLLISGICVCISFSLFVLLIT